MYLSVGANLNLLHLYSDRCNVGCSRQALLTNEIFGYIRGPVGLKRN
jgi:hypothetical protein